MAIDLPGAVSYSAIVPNNTTGVVIKAGPGILLDYEAFTNGAVIGYWRFYDMTTAPLTSSTPVRRLIVPATAGSSGSGLNLSLKVPWAFYFGIAYRFTINPLDNDATSPAATTFFINVGWQ